MALVALAPGRCALAAGGALFITGHDSDDHAQVAGPQGTSAQHINQRAVAFLQAGNPFYPAASKFLFVESTDALSGGHMYGKGGIDASGFIAGTDYEAHTAADLAGEIAKLGSKYYALVVASDFGGELTQAELSVLTSNRNTIIAFLNAGGGIFVLPEGTPPLHLTTSGQYGFLPSVPVSLGCNGPEAGMSLTAFGTSLGLVTSDVDVNEYHACFSQDYGLDVVDSDASGHIVTIAGHTVLPCDSTGVKKDFKNTTGQTANALEITLSGVYGVVLDHYDGPPGNEFATFTHVSGVSTTVLRWSGGASIPPNAFAHVGFVVPGTTFHILGVAWFSGTTLLGCVPQVNASARLSGSVHPSVTYGNTLGGCQPNLVWVGDLKVEYYPHTAFLESLLVEIPRNPLHIDIIAAPPAPLGTGDSISVLIPGAPVGATCAVLVFKVSPTANMSDPAATADFLVLPVAQAPTSALPGIGPWSLAFITFAMLTGGLIAIQARRRRARSARVA